MTQLNGTDARIARMETTLQHIDDRTEETLQLVRAQGEIVQGHGESLAALAQWRQDHEAQTHKTVADEIKTLRQRDATGGGIAAIIGGIVGIIAALEI